LQEFYGLSGGHSECEPLDPISNSDVKPFSADVSVGFPHVKVGHCQALVLPPGIYFFGGFFLFDKAYGQSSIVSSQSNGLAHCRLAMTAALPSRLLAAVIPNEMRDLGTYGFFIVTSYPAIMPRNLTAYVALINSSSLTFWS
jgi:hypothetical protein